MTDDTEDSPVKDKDSDWTRDALYKIATEALRENQRHRRWKIIMTVVILFFMTVSLLLISNLGSGSAGSGGYDGSHIAVVSVEGLIDSTTPAAADLVIDNLEDAFAAEDSVAVMLRINSPGGSPVESGRINDALYRLREKYSNKKIYAVVGNICASGGYYIAVAADQIYADKASLVGSIGVLRSAFGFTGLMEKIGIERRLETSGENKGMLDSFSPERPEDVEHLQVILDSIHQQFIDVVLAGRGPRIDYTDESLFSGLIWSGEQALELGLIDNLGDSNAVVERLNEETGMELELVIYDNTDPLDKIFDKIGTSMFRVISSLGTISLG